VSLDKIHPLKMESIASGGDSEDDYPTSADSNHDYMDVRGVVIQNDVSNDDTVVVGRDSSSNLTLQDAITGAKTLAQLAAGTGMTPETHRVLDQLVHDLAENFFEEYTYSGGNVTNATTWETSGKLKKIREEQYTYSSGKVSQAVTIQYDGSGNEVERLTETYTYSGSKIASVTAVRATP
jgi:hypothetical protein